MAKPMPSAEDALLLELLRAIEASHGPRRLRWCGHAELADRLPDVTPAQLDAAIAVAASRGWLETGGTPAHSVLLTAAGRLEITRRRKP